MRDVIAAILVAL